MSSSFEYDLTAMSRVLIFIRSPLAKTYVGIYLGKTDLEEVSRRDFDTMWNITPTPLGLLAIGGMESYLTLRRGAEHFDKYFSYSYDPSPQKECVNVNVNVNVNNYTMKDMEKCLAQIQSEIEVHELVEDVLVKAMEKTKVPTVSAFVKSNRKWLLGGSMASALGLVVVLYFFVKRHHVSASSSNSETTSSITLSKSKRKHVGE